MIYMKGKGSGWKGESRRHSLARKGVKTAHGCNSHKHTSKGILSGNCPHCKSDLSKHGTSYDGAIGYQAMICRNCGWYWDHQGIYEKDDWSEKVMRSGKSSVTAYDPIFRAEGKVETVYEDQFAEREHFKVGKFSWVVDGNSVIVTKDTPDGLFENVAVYEYKNFNQASDSAYRMAVKQANAKGGLKASGEMQFQTPIDNDAFERELQQAFKDVGSDGDYAYPNEFYTVILRVPDAKFEESKVKAIAIAKKHGVELKFEEHNGKENWLGTNRIREDEIKEKKLLIKLKKEFPNDKEFQEKISKIIEDTNGD